MSSLFPLPSEFGLLLRKFTAKYSVCQIPFYPEHFEEHGLSGVRIAEIFSELDRIEQNLKNQVPEIVKCGKVSKVRKVSKGNARLY